VKSLLAKCWHSPLHFLFYFSGAIIVFSVLFFTQQSIPQGIPNSDKIGHIAVFFILALLLFKAVKFKRIWQILLLLSYGIGVECIQHFIPYRAGSLADVVADATGLLFFYLLTCNATLRRKLKAQ